MDCLIQERYGGATHTEGKESAHPTPLAGRGKWSFLFFVGRANNTNGWSLAVRVVNKVLVNKEYLLLQTSTSSHNIYEVYVHNIY